MRNIHSDIRFFYNYSCLPKLDNLYSFFKTWALFYLNKALMKETSMFYGSNFYEWYYSTKFKLISKFGYNNELCLYKNFDHFKN